MLRCAVTAPEACQLWRLSPHWECVLKSAAVASRRLLWTANPAECNLAPVMTSHAAACPPRVPRCCRREDTGRTHSGLAADREVVLVSGSPLGRVQGRLRHAIVGDDVHSRPHGVEQHGGLQRQQVGEHVCVWKLFRSSTLELICRESYSRIHGFKGIVDQYCTGTKFRMTNPS
jgi:hypothetical protein